MDLLPLIAIPVLYFLIAFIKPTLQPKLPFNLCAICTAVNLTWIALLSAYFYGISLSPTTLAILMGMSVTGLMYKMEALYKTNKLHHFWWVRMVVIISGFYGITRLLESDWSALLLTTLVSFFAIILPTFLMQGESRASETTKRLDDCC